jgi:hypothetical protein
MKKVVQLIVSVFFYTVLEQNKTSDKITVLFLLEGGWNFMFHSKNI